MLDPVVSTAGSQFEGLRLGNVDASIVVDEEPLRYCGSKNQLAGFYRAQTPEYQEVRRTHQKIERKLGEVVRHHGGRRARCRGQPKILIQELMTILVVNVRRITQLHCAGPTPCPAR